MTKLNSKAKRILYPILFIIPAIFNQEIYVSLYVDVILAIMGVYLIIFYEYAKIHKIHKKFVFLNMSLATLFLVNTCEEPFNITPVVPSLLVPSSKSILPELKLTLPPLE